MWNDDYGGGIDTKYYILEVYNAIPPKEGRLSVGLIN